MNALTLVTLGGLSLAAPGGDRDVLLTQRRKLALLVVLALATRPVPRDVLVEMFWGGEDEDRARHSLSNALSTLRRVLGRDAIATRQSEISLGEDLRLAVDVLQFRAACECGDYARAVALYGGPFLDGVYVERSPSFEEWVARRRARFERMFREASARAAALAESATPAPAVASTAVAETPPPGRVPTPAAPIPQGEVVARPDVLDSRPGRRRRGWWLAAAAAGLVTMVLAGKTLLESPNSTRGVRTDRPVIAVASIASTSSDTAAAWLGSGMQQMISAGLARSSRVEAVAPSRVREVLVRSRLADQPMLFADQARDVARRLGATWVVQGGVTPGAGGLIVLDITLRDVASGKRLALFTVSGTNPMVVADQATARLVSNADANEAGPHLADVETANLDAYQHYVQAYQAFSEGRTPESKRELDAAIAADSGFASAIVMRLDLARATDDGATQARLIRAYEHAAPRATRWDRLYESTYAAMRNGERSRAEALSRELVARFPHDPRAYTRLADVLALYGRFAAADTVFQQALSLDSLATRAGTGACAPCAGYGGLAELRADFGDLHDAETAARRWVELQPDVPRAHSELSHVLAYEGRFDAAIAEARRALWLGGDASAPFYMKRLASLLLIARRYESADSLIQPGLHDSRPQVRGDAADLLAMLQRERGQYRAAARTVESLIERDSLWAPLDLVRANSLARVGEFSKVAAAIRPALAFQPTAARITSPSLEGERARKFAWEHTLMADLMRSTLDTTQLAATADSVEAASARSYYGRDWRLAHHLRGLIDARAGRYEQAVREFQAARWGYGGWTRTNVAMARALLALSRVDSAIVVLRDAYRSPLDAMGRYVPHSELDYWMAVAMSRGNMRDSAAVYSARVRRAWRDADPEIRARLADLDALPGRLARRR